MNYFGQEYDSGNCAACDHCLGDTEDVADAVVIAQKILSCVARVQERFGAGYVIEVLRGQNTERIRKCGHEKLSTYGLLREFDPRELRDWIYQLIGQQVLQLEAGEYPILKLNAASWEVLRGQRKVRLVQPVRSKSAKKSQADTASWEGVDKALFDELRKLRKNMADQRGVAPYVILHDSMLRDLARIRPSNAEKLRTVYGFGDRRVSELADHILPVINQYCADHALSMDQKPAPAKPATPALVKPTAMSPGKVLAFNLFHDHAAIEDVVHQTGRARSTIMDYLAQYITEEKPKTISHWITADKYAVIAAAVEQVGPGRLKPIFDALNGVYAYDEIRLVAAHMAPPST